MRLYRTKLTPGESCYAWSFEPLSMRPQLIAPKGQITDLTTYRLGWPACEWELPYHAGFNLPTGIPPGQYFIKIDNNSIPIEVTSPIVRNAPIRIPLDASLADVEAALGKGDIEFSPGRYKFERTWSIYWPNRRIYFNGATLVRSKSGDYLNRLIVPANGTELIGPGTLEAFDDQSIYLHGDTAINCRLERITFYGGGFGYWDNSGLRVKDCIFDKCWMTNIRNGLWTGNKHRGLSRDLTGGGSGTATAFSIPNGGSICVLDAEFESTQQGIRLEPVNGPLEEVFIAGVRYKNIDASNNQCELFGAEGGNQIRRVVYFHHRESGCVGPAIVLWNAPIASMLLRDGRSDSTVYLSGNAIQQGIRVEDWEASGFEAVGGASTGNTFTRCLYRPWPSQQNQFGDGRPWQPNKPGFRVESNVMVDCKTVSANPA